MEQTLPVFKGRQASDDLEVLMGDYLLCGGASAERKLDAA
jgi:hypothetical protein